MASTQSPTFAELLREYRRRSELSQEALAEHAGLSRRGVSDLERGVKQAPHAMTVDRLADALHLSATERAAFASAARLRRVSSAGVPARSPSIQADDAPLLVGRERELALLEQHLAGNGPPLLLFAGEPGMGKSRLLAEVSARAESLGWRVLRGGCQRRSGEEPYEPFASILSRTITSTPPARQRAELAGCNWLVRLLPELAERGILSAPTSSVRPEQERRMLFAAVRRYLINLAGPGGALLVLDDLQWAGGDALHVLADLAREAGDGRLGGVRVVGAYRDTEAPPEGELAFLLADLARDDLVLRRQVGPLARPDAAELLARLLADPSTAASAPEFDRRAEILSQTGGVPYYLVSYARELLAHDTDGVAGFAGGETHGVPWTVAHSIRVRIGRLPERARELLGVAAVIGRVAPAWLLLAAAVDALDALDAEEFEHGGPQHEQQVVRAVDAARAAGLLGENGPAYHFTHDLIREVTLDDMSGVRARGIHRRVAEALLRLPEGLRERHLAEITYHLLEAEQGRPALPYALQAGDHAARIFAYDEAERYYRLAESLATAYADAPRTAVALEGLGRVLRLQGRYDEALETLRAAGEGYEALGAVEGIGRVTAQMAWTHLDRGSSEAGIAELGPVASLLRTQGLSQGQLTAVYLALAQLYIQTGRFVELLTAAQEVLALTADGADGTAGTEGVDATGGGAARQEAASMLELARTFTGETQKLASLADRSPAITQTDDPEAICRTLLTHAHVCNISGALVRGEQYITRALAVAERSGNQDLVAACIGQRGHYWLECGQWGRAREDFERAEALTGTLSSASWLPLIRVHHGYLCLLAGETTTGVRMLEQEIAATVRTGNFFAGNWARYRLAEWELVNGRPAEARAWLEPVAAEETRNRGAGMHASAYAWALLDLGEAAAAEALIAQALAGLTGDPHSRTNALRIQALVFIRQGRWDEARAAVENSLALARSLRYVFGEARTLYVAGLLHRAQGDREQARERFEEALAICDQLGEALYRPHIMRALDDLAAETLVADE